VKKGQLALNILKSRQIWAPFRAPPRPADGPFRAVARGFRCSESPTLLCSELPNLPSLRAGPHDLSVLSPNAHLLWMRERGTAAAPRRFVPDILAQRAAARHGSLGRWT